MTILRRRKTSEIMKWASDIIRKGEGETSVREMRIAMVFATEIPVVENMEKRIVQLETEISEAHLYDQRYHDGFADGMTAAREKLGIATLTMEKLLTMLPKNHSGYACNFCDMGDAGYSRLGPGTHDDGCPAHWIRDAVERIKR